MLTVSNLECIRGERRLFSGIGFNVTAGELVYLKGQNGSGKTSLLRLLCGLSPPASGDIRWHGTPTRQLGEAYRSQLCYLGHQHAIKEELTPLENLQTSGALNGNSLATDQATEALARVGLAGHMDLACRYLSQGQKRRVALARLISEKRPLWLLDEPFVALDTHAARLVANLIAAHLRHGGMAVLTTHQPFEIAAERTYELAL